MLRNRFHINRNPEPPEGEKTGRFAGLVGTGFILGALISFFGLGSILGVGPLQLLTGEGLARLGFQQTPSEKLIAQGSVIDIARKTQPSVVGIQTRQGKSGSYADPGAEGGFESVGSGVIIRRDGYIMTNSHVVGDASSIIVTLDKEKVPAEIVGSDKDTDIAVIKINKDRLPVASIGSAKKLQVGELAVAIGSPFGFQRSVTAGVISALNRHVTVGEEADRPRTYTNLIQTDAAINPGNSGGALINRRGEVIGINTLIYSTNGVSQGIGFAIPVEEAKGIAEELVAEGQVSHPFIGIEGQTVAPDEIKNGADIEEGARVESVAPGGPAEEAGIRRGDTIVEFDGHKIYSMDDLVAAVRKAEIDQPSIIKIIRDGGVEMLTIRVANRPGNAS